MKKLFIPLLAVVVCPVDHGPDDDWRRVEPSSFPVAEDPDAVPGEVERTHKRHRGRPGPSEDQAVSTQRKVHDDRPVGCLARRPLRPGSEAFALRPVGDAEAGQARRPVERGLPARASKREIAHSRRHVGQPGRRGLSRRVQPDDHSSAPLGVSGAGVNADGGVPTSPFAFVHPGLDGRTGKARTASMRHRKRRRRTNGRVKARPLVI